MKKTLLGLLGFILLSTLVPATAQQSGEFTYTSDGSAITITGYTGSGGAVAIPDTITGRPVRIIGMDAFQNKANLTSVTIPNSVTNIEGFAFDSCANLTSVTIGNSVTSIGVAVFWRCSSLTSVTIPNSVTSIGNQAFYFCTNLTSVTIGNGVTSIGLSAFESCTSLTNVMIPASVASIGYWAFNSCTNLSAITVDALNPVYSSVDGVLFNKSQTLFIMFPGGKAGGYTVPNSVTSIEYSAFRFCTRLTSVNIPNSVTNMGDQAFAFCTGLKSVTIPNSVSGIGFFAFGRCDNLASVAIPDSVTSIAGQAFDYCTSLTNVVIPASVTSIGGSAFQNCASLTAITVDAANVSYSSADGVLFNKNRTTLIQCPGGKAGSYSIPNSVTNIDFSAFSSCTSLTSVTIPNSVTSIGVFAFYSCTNLTSATIGNGVTSIGAQAFLGCTSLSAITVDALNSVYSSVDGVFFNKSQTVLIIFPGGKAGSYVIPNNVISIGDYAFASCTRLTSVTVPNSVTSIGGEAFFHCTSLASVTIGNGVTWIGEIAFYSCTSLMGVYFQGNAPSDGFDVFEDANNATVYYLPGTTGWGTTFAGRPAVLWNLRVQTGEASFGVRTNRFGFTITGTADIPLVVEASTTLANPMWVALQSLNLTNGAFDFSDPDWTNYPARIYRIRSP